MRQDSSTLETPAGLGSVFGQAEGTCPRGRPSCVCVTVSEPRLVRGRGLWMLGPRLPPASVGMLCWGGGERGARVSPVFIGGAGVRGHVAIKPGSCYRVSGGCGPHPVIVLLAPGPGYQLREVTTGLR